MARGLFTAAKEDHACPKCGVPKGTNCRTPKGRLADYPHRERMALLTQADVDAATIVGVDPRSILG